MSLSFNDFQKQDISFDINKLRNACDDVLKIKGFDTSLGIPHFAGIPLNQIPNDPNSIKGNKVRGIYWTKPNSSGEEVTRDVNVEESKYTQFVEEFKNTYFKEVYNELQKSYRLGRVRLLLKKPR
ncbi:uncharacterized protein METZ01_LOCUS503525, partial [marine metagenome]